MHAVGIHKSAFFKSYSSNATLKRQLWKDDPDSWDRESSSLWVLLVTYSNCIILEDEEEQGWRFSFLKSKINI